MKEFFADATPAVSRVPDPPFAFARSPAIIRRPGSAAGERHNAR
jgi:hypothetical protein